MSNNSFWAAPDLSLAAFIAKIIIGQCTNIQDGAILHGDPGKVTVLEDYVTVGHRAVIHSAHIERGCLIGIGAVILDGVRVGAGSIIGAGSIVTKHVSERSLVVGVPARKVREISDEQVAELLEHARRYEKLALVHAGKGTDIGFTSNKE